MVMKWQTMMMILAKTGKNCVEPRNTTSKATSSVDRHVAIGGVETVEELLGLQGVWRKKMKMMKMNKRWCRASPRLMKPYKKLRLFSMRKVEATRTVKAF